MRSWKLIFVVILFTLVSNSCKKIESTYKLDLSQGLLILNQGNFTYSNASITFYNTSLSQTYQDVFFQINSFKLGDVVQSAIIIDNTIFIVVNNSGRIIGVDRQSFKVKCVITGLTSPRYMSAINDSVALVTDLYDDISIVDLKTCQKIGTISVGFSTESILQYGNYVFILNWSFGNRIIRLDKETLDYESLILSYQPNSIVIDKNNKLWVLSDGGLWEGSDTIEQPALTVINPDSFQIEKIYRFDSLNISPTHLNINTAGDTLYFLVSSWQNTYNQNYGVYKMSIADSCLPLKPFITQGDNTFYCLSYIREINKLAVCDAKDFVSKGSVLLYSTIGKPVDQIPAGIIPGFVIYKY